MRTIARWGLQRPASGAFPAHPHTLAMLGLQRDTTMIAAFVRALRKKLGH